MKNHLITSSEVRTQRLLLRSIVEDDLEQLYLGLSDPDVIQHYGVNYSSLEETKAQLDFYTELEKHNTGKWWAICDVLTNEFYGAIGLNDLKVEHKKAELGFWLLKEHWGKGYISEVFPEICKFGFEKRKLHRIEAIVEQENTNSKKCLIKNNFLLEGTMKECEIKNGRYISLEIYAKLNS